MEGGFDLNDRLPSETGERLTVKTDDAITPVTIKQLIDANLEPGKNILIDGVPRKQVSIVGLIERVTDDAIVSYYDVNDSTGIFQVQDFTKDMETLTESFQQGTYVSIVGKISFSDSDRQPIISAFSVKKVVDFNQIPCHLLQALFVHLLTLRGLPSTSAFEIKGKLSQGSTVSSLKPTEDSSSEEVLCNEVLEFLRINKQIDGTPKEEIVSHLSSRFSIENISSALSTLEYRGEIYTSSPNRYVIC
ncbi:replication protein A, subunit RPA32 [Histomonas meleagridis]|uniref:replication protein A, subunit RPA32 n=1 Tax=Histomonas meleagridis TaxID=135588 RepID=UPI00355978A5|nr:replication protein A, subunit RPA32 [Histomonas meleagridis]KAH0805068.1 replication protein A, subunit RPA32 [Histomonas meleagridis]